MTTTDQAPPLPKDLPTLRRHYLPPEPDGTTVTALRAAVARIDVAAVAAREAIDRTRQLDRVVVDQLVDGADFDTVVAQLDPGDRAALAHRVAMLADARTTAMYRLAHAEHTDPVHVAWLAECRRIEADWNMCLSSAGDDHERFNALLRFVDQHRLAS